MRVLLMTPPYIPGYMRNARWDGMGASGSQWYPIYLAYCTGLLEKEGHEVRLLDAQVDRLTHEETYRRVQDFSPSLTVMYHSMKSLDNDMKVAEQVRTLTDSEIVLVGHSSSMHGPEMLDKSPYVGMIARGEFDFTVLDIANQVPRDEVKGLVWKDSSGAIHINPPREPVTGEQLDTLPFVTDVYRRHLNLRNYSQSCHRYPFVDLFTGRGCAWGLCSFCLWPNTLNRGARYRTRTISNVTDELRFVREEMPFVKEVYFQDDVLPGDRARELSEAILSANLKVCWSAYSRANLNLDTMKLMKRAGCRLLEVGFESCNKEVLKNIKKGVTVKQMERFAQDAQDAGLLVIGAFITGLPGETVESVKATTAWARKLPLLRYTITLPKPYPGTPLYQSLETDGHLTDGRPDYPDLTTDDIYRWNKWSVRHVFLSWDYFFRIARRPSQWASVLRAAKYFMPYVTSREDQGVKDMEW